MLFVRVLACWRSCASLWHSARARIPRVHTFTGIFHRHMHTCAHALHRLAWNNSRDRLCFCCVNTVRRYHERACIPGKINGDIFFFSSLTIKHAFTHIRGTKRVSSIIRVQIEEIHSIAINLSTYTFHPCAPRANRLNNGSMTIVCTCVFGCSSCGQIINCLKCTRKRAHKLERDCWAI